MRRVRSRGVAVVLAVLAGGCGDTLVDHDATWLQETQGSACGGGQVACPVEGALVCELESTSSCGASCTDCATTVAPPAGADAACLGAGAGEGTCGYACRGGKLKCPSGCCDAIALAAGDEHTCAITSDHSLVCWGLNNWGQVTSVNSSDPVTVPHQVFPSEVTAVAAGHYHTCAVVAGAVQCWGWNADGQTTPPAGLAGATALAAGYYHSCAIAGAGDVRCWGRNELDQAAGGSPMLAGAAVAISAGWDHTCVVLESGGVQCWGSNAVAQLGDGSAGGSSGTPTTPSLEWSANFIASGRHHVCAANGDDGLPVVCWGAQPGPLFGLGNPQTTPAQPTKDNGDATFKRDVVAMAAGRTHTCVIRGGTPTQDVQCFGPDNTAGQLGGTPAEPAETASVANSVGAKAVAAGADHACAIFADGSVSCWGMNSSGQLGDGTTAFPGVGQVVAVSGR